MKTYKRVGEKSSILKVNKDGTVVTLSDGSRWTMREGDISKAITWYPTQHIIVMENDSDIYPYRLKNLNTYSDVAEASLL
jgi:hypothetical protein